MNWTAVAQLIRLPNQTGTLLLLLPSLWALVAASEGAPPLSLLAVFTAGAFLMRSLGVVLNDLVDRPIDRQVERTRTRPLARGDLGTPAALGVAAVLTALAASLLLFLNGLAIALSPVAFVLASLYPLAKRAIHLPQAVLGLAFGWGAVMAWAAVRGSLDTPAWLLFGATICWAIAYDTIYALQDREDDRRIGVKSAAILFGRWTWAAVAAASVAMTICLGGSGWLLGAGGGFYLVLAVVLGFLLRQAWTIRDQDVPRSRAFALFRQHVWVGWAVLGGYWVGLAA